MEELAPARGIWTIVTMKMSPNVGRVLQGYFRVEQFRIKGNSATIAQPMPSGRPAPAPDPPRPDLLPAAMRRAAVQPKADREPARTWSGAPRPELLPGMRPAIVGGLRRVAQARPSHGVSTTPVPPGYLRVIGKGRPLEPGIRQTMEAFFQADFSGVRVHQGPTAQAMGALAFTLGEDLHFAPGLYDPESRKGVELLGHELTHVVQQREGRVANPYGQGVAIVQDPALEAEADRRGQQIAEELWSGSRVTQTGVWSGRLALLRKSAGPRSGLIGGGSRMPRQAPPERKPAAAAGARKLKAPRFAAIQRMEEKREEESSTTTGSSTNTNTNTGGQVEIVALMRVLKGGPKVFLWSILIDDDDQEMINMGMSAQKYLENENQHWQTKSEESLKVVSEQICYYSTTHLVLNGHSSYRDPKTGKTKTLAQRRLGGVGLAQIANVIANSILKSWGTLCHIEFWNCEVGFKLSMNLHDEVAVGRVATYDFDCAMYEQVMLNINQGNDELVSTLEFIAAYIVKFSLLPKNEEYLLAMGEICLVGFNGLGFYDGGKGPIPVLDQEHCFSDYKAIQELEKEVREHSNKRKEIQIEEKTKKIEKHLKNRRCDYVVLRVNIQEIKKAIERKTEKETEGKTEEK